MKKRHLAGAIAVAAGLALGLAGCAPGGSTAADSSRPVSKDVSGKDVTIKILDFWQNDEGKWMDAVVKDFEKQHPNITIKRTTQDWGQVMNTLNLRLADANGPDIALVNNGWQSMGTLAKGGRILNLDAYSKLYGWDKEIPDTISRQLEFTPDGKQMGTGSLFATPAARSSLIGLYYNKTMLDQLGLPVPTTLAEFEKDAAAIKAAGKTPIAFGSQDKGSATSILFATQNLYAPADKIGDFVYSSGNVPITDTGIVDAATDVKKWADDGWFTPNYPGIQYADAQNDFLTGKAAFRFEYTGSLAFSEAQKQTFGYVQLPQVEGDKVVGTGASAANLAISSKSKNPDAAAAFLDFMASKTAAQEAVDHGFLPLLHSDLSIPSGNPELASEITAQQALDKGNGYVPYFDWSTPTMLDTIGGQLQQLFAGQVTPQQLGEAGQKDYDAFQAQRAKG
ncbi:ABC transporter substrate-binding protein [Leifsonia sp. NPDC102414]|jgi:raffinose/stachyose/melibiose transport system substrate-binding protein|uniref:ABC transporter substrate-binding protein n=1 Tax=unclassified Leifsonia TaxID=2663824 RepID=UPI0009E9896B|nr:extracellular solute-binding protein [Leifsonia sp. Root227]